MGVVQNAPLRAHLSADALVKQKLIGLALVLLAIHQCLVLKAVILAVGTRNDVIDLVETSVGELVDVDGPSGIQAPTSLHEIQGQALIKVIGRGFLDFLPDPGVVLLKRLESLLQLVIAAPRALALALLVLVTRDFDEDV